MTSSSAKKLKITAVNIRSVLTNNNKKIGKLNIKKKNLVRRQRLQAERAAEEKNIEKKSGPIKSVLTNITQGVMSMKDRILNFFGWLLAGWLIDKLPAIIKFLTRAWNFISPLIKITWNIIKFIAKSLVKFGSFVGSFFNKGEAESNVDSLSQSSDAIRNEANQLAAVPLPALDGDGATVAPPNNEVKSNVNPEPKLNRVTGEGLNERTPPKLNRGDNSSATINSSTVSKSIASDSITKNITKTATSFKQSAKRVIRRIQKNPNNLIGNLEKNVKTVIVPIEIEKMVPSGNNTNGGGSINVIEPIPSTSGYRSPND